jgi:peptidoglycan/LPS O-acetylase OafA/YrhL
MSNRVDHHRQRLPELDLLRFCAATAVVLYHWTYLPDVGGVPSRAAFGPLQDLTRYGYLGVDLFFMISGFVIFWSALSRNAASFLASRISRLYPTFWVCLSLTALILLVSGRAPPTLDVKSFLLHLTMAPGPFGLAFIDEVYWTLFFELKFYLLVAMALAFLPRRSMEPALYVWLGMSAVVFVLLQAGSPSIPLKVLKSVTLLPYAQLFIAGAILFFIWNEGANSTRLFALGLCLAIEIMNALDQQANFAKDLSGGTTLATIALVSVLFGLFLSIAMKAWRLPASGVWQQLGALTYPLYLLHHAIGKTVWKGIPEAYGHWWRLLIMTIVIGALTWIVTTFIEKRWPARLNAVLQKIVEARSNPKQTRPA